MPTSTPPMRSTVFSPPARLSSCSALVALATLAAALLHGPALAGLGLVGAYVTPLLVASRAAGLLVALHLSRGRDRRRLRARALPDVALARHHRDRLQRAVDLARASARSAVDALGAHAFHVIVGFALAAALIVAGLLARAGCGARPHRRRVVGGARRLPARRDPAGAGEPARSARACDLRRCSSRRRSRSPGARKRRPRRCRSRRVLVALVFAALGGSISISSAWSCRPVRSPARCRSRRTANAGWHLVLGSRLRGAVRRRRLSGAGPLGAADRAVLWSAAAVFAPIAILAALYYRIAGFEPSIPFAAAALLLARALCVRDRDAGQARAAAGTCRRERDLRHRRGRRACARADHWRWRTAGSRSRSR